MKKTTLIVIGLLLFTPNLYAKKGHHKNIQRKIFKQLDLSKDQRIELKQIRKSKKGLMQSLREEKRNLKKKMSQAMRNNAQEPRLRRIHKNLMNIQNKIKNSRFETMLAIRGVLTAEQRETYFELKKKMKKQRGKKDL